jgi:hypothetical protein
MCHGDLQKDSTDFRCRNTIFSAFEFQDIARLPEHCSAMVRKLHFADAHSDGPSTIRRYSSYKVPGNPCPCGSCP